MQSFDKNCWLVYLSIWFCQCRSFDTQNSTSSSLWSSIAEADGLGPHFPHIVVDLLLSLLCPCSKWLLYILLLRQSRLCVFVYGIYTCTVIVQCCKCLQSLYSALSIYTVILCWCVYIYPVIVQCSVYIQWYSAVCVYIKIENPVVWKYTVVTHTQPFSVYGKIIYHL